MIADFPSPLEGEGGARVSGRVRGVYSSPSAPGFIKPLESTICLSALTKA